MVHLHPPYQNVYYIAKLYCKTSASYVPIGMSVFLKSPKEFGTSEGLLRFLFVLCKMLAQRSS